MRTICRAARASLDNDAYLLPFQEALRARAARIANREAQLTNGDVALADFAAGHTYFGLHRAPRGWVLREWAPAATELVLVGTFSDWREDDAFRLTRLGDHGEWEIVLSEDVLHHGDLYRLRVRWEGGEGDRIPSYARRVVQDADTHVFNAQVWAPEAPYTWRHPGWQCPERPALVYEAHVGMAQEREGVGTYEEFRRHTLPRIRDAGYNTIQLMAVTEHPYYGSFGYHVSSFFAASSRYGTPEELKHLVDEAHGMGLTVIMDLVHSHAVRNEVEGLARFDGTPHQYFHAGARGEHPAWDSKCFDYGKPEVLHFLLSNCRFWLDEYRFDGYRFDGVTSMLYRHHGLGDAFTSYGQYFNETVDDDAFTYLALANKVVHAVRPDAITVAEDVSGMPGLGAPPASGGLGFDYRLAMGLPDFWFRTVQERRDEDWDMWALWHELTNRRADERTISYVESHDQAIVGSKTMVFELMDAAMYTSMRVTDEDALIDRGMALHKMICLITLALAGDGYLTFMGNEFGHPEWVDFPRDGNGWSYHYARRQWSLRDNDLLKYRFLAEFDRAMLEQATSHRMLEQDIKLVSVHNEDNILVFAHGELFFFFNFHPVRSVTDYFVELPPGIYRLVLDTDAAAFGGQARLQPAQTYPTQTQTEGRLIRRGIMVYLPCRTAIVVAREWSPAERIIL